MSDVFVLLAVTTLIIKKMLTEPKSFGVGLSWNERGNRKGELGNRNTRGSSSRGLYGFQQNKSQSWRSFGRVLVKNSVYSGM